MRCEAHRAPSAVEQARGLEPRSQHDRLMEHPPHLAALPLPPMALMTLALLADMKRSESWLKQAYPCAASSSSLDDGDQRKHWRR